MTEREALKLALETLEANRQTHRYCEDTWYSCPKHEDGCANDFEGDECNCGADTANFQIDYAITAIKEALAQPEQEPVAMKFKIYKPTVPDPVRQGINNALLPWVYDQDRSSGFDASMWVTPVATLPPQRKPLTDEEIKAVCAETWSYDPYVIARAIEAAHGIKGEA